MGYIACEIKVLKKIQGKNLLEYLDSFYTSEESILIFTKFYQDGNLSDYMKNSGGKLPLNNALKILKIFALAFVGLEDLDLRNEDGKRETKSSLRLQACKYPDGR